MGHATLWGDEQTRFFFELTPDRVLAAVEASGLRGTGRCSALNSFENRVYDLELESEDGTPGAHVIAKFYRPGRWSPEQIAEEHEFLRDLKEAEIPAIAPLEFPDGGTRGRTEAGIWYALFPRVGGRAPDELDDDQLVRIGRLLGRVHNVGALRPAAHRIRLEAASYGTGNLEFLLKADVIPLENRRAFEEAARAIIAAAEERLHGVPVQRIHGDCHLGNLLWNREGPFFLDFDDMVRGPAVQDVWMLTPARDAFGIAQREKLLEGYEEMRAFDRATLSLIELLRALRFIHYCAWIARRWADPAFPRAFPNFGTRQYWEKETRDLAEQLALLG